MPASPDPIAALQHLDIAESNNLFHGITSMQLVSYSTNMITPASVSLSLPAGFTVSATSVVTFVIPPGFTFNPGYGQEIQIVAQAPMATNNWSAPSFLGPVSVPLGSIPAGYTFGWAVRSGNNTFSNTTLTFTLYNVLTPMQPTPGGNFYIWITGTGGTQCRYVASCDPITATQ